MLYNKPATYDHFRLFGCLGYCSTIKAHRDKFSPRSDQCVFIGYPARIKGYKLLHLQTKKIIISRDVFFYEHIFPFKLNTQQDIPVAISDSGLNF